MSANSREEWLRLLLQAEDAAAERGIDRRSFMLMPRGGMQRSMDHPGWEDDWPLPTEHDIDDLLEASFVRLTVAEHGKARQFILTTEGRVQAQRLERMQEHAAAVPVSMDWAELEPVLDAAVTAFEQAGAPAGGVAVQSFAAPGTARAAVAELARVELLSDSGGGVDQEAEPAFVQPSLDAYKLTRGWPGDAADAAVERLVRVLLDSAEKTDDPDERSRLERVASWLGKFGSTVIQGTTTGVTTAIITHGGHLPS